MSIKNPLSNWKICTLHTRARKHNHTTPFSFLCFFVPLFNLRPDCTSSWPHTPHWLKRASSQNTPKFAQIGKLQIAQKSYLSFRFTNNFGFFTYLCRNSKLTFSRIRDTFPFLYVIQFLNILLGFFITITKIIHKLTECNNPQTDKKDYFTSDNKIHNIVTGTHKLYNNFWNHMYRDSVVRVLGNQNFPTQSN